MQAVSPVDPVAGVLSSLPALPAVGGLEGVGVVEAAGPGSSLKAGDWVIPAPGAGCWTTHAVFDDAQLTPVPNNIPCEYAAVRKSSRVRSRMLTYAHVRSRTLTSAENHASCEHALVLHSLLSFIPPPPLLTRRFCLCVPCACAPVSSADSLDAVGRRVCV
jgi:threonine dehydrogenase-like Zn-dependent dehydrogenase